MTKGLMDLALPVLLTAPKRTSQKSDSMAVPAE